MKEDNWKEIQLEAINTIDEYYDYSFKIRNSQCYPLISRLIQQLEKVLGYVDVEQREILQEVLLNIVNAMSENDYVKLRDVLYYDLKEKMQKAMVKGV